MYKGFLKALHLKRDGTFSYVVLSHVTKLFLVLDGDAPATTPMASWRAVGTSVHGVGDEQDVGTRQLRESLLVIEGEDIANVVFDRYEVGFPVEISSDDLDRAVRDALGTMCTVE